MKVVSRTYFVVGVAVALMAALYWFASYEHAGTVMLVLAAGLALFLGLYLAYASRRTTAHAGDEPEPYLPHASAWPFFIGVAALVALNGLALGLWALVPGVVALGLALLGFAGQSRRRD